MPNGGIDAKVGMFVPKGGSLCPTAFFSFPKPNANILLEDVVSYERMTQVVRTGNNLYSASA